MGTLLEGEDFNVKEIKEHEIVQGEVVLVNRNEAYVAIGSKQEIPIPKNELAYPAPESAEDVVKTGDIIDVYVVAVGGENGATLSKVKADKLAAWKEFDGIVEREEILEAHVTQVVKGGLVATVRGLRAFIPASQIELHFVKDLNVYVGETLNTLPIECDVKKLRLVLSRRKLLERERDEKQSALFATLAEGQKLHGVVKRIVDYGVFIDIGGVDGLAHISDLAWRRVKHPSEVMKVGQEVDVIVKRFDPETKRISLSVKDTMEDPWYETIEKYNEGDHIQGEIVKLMDFGAFMKIEPGFDGLIPMSELSAEPIERADQVVNVGDVVTVRILHIDKKRKRISLSMTKVKEGAEVKKYECEPEQSATEQSATEQPAAEQPAAEAAEAAGAAGEQ